MPSRTADTQHLIEQVRSAAAGGPYVVVERPYGFDLTVDEADAGPADHATQQGPEPVVTHRVRVDEASRALSITDVSHSARWDEAAPDRQGRELVREVAEALGWRERQGRDRRLALAVAGIAAAGLLVAGLIALVITLSG
ncbi:MAG: hypothetical protein HOQ27_17830 [Dermatophilaceae bacterium]|nr:hypothetical protein [Dermatophilaceae bacterium]NUR80445.1 hypothetical protein [Dermatophilaceae bacterium]